MASAAGAAAASTNSAAPDPEARRAEVEAAAARRIRISDWIARNGALLDELKLEKGKRHESLGLKPPRRAERKRGSTPNSSLCWARARTRARRPRSRRDRSDDRAGDDRTGATRRRWR